MTSVSASSGAMALSRRTGGRPAVDVVFARGAAGVLKRPGADVRGNGGGNPPLLQEPDRQIPVVGSDVGQARALRHEIGQQLQSRGEL